MLHVATGCVVIDCGAEIGLLYTDHDPAPGQFSCPKPYHNSNHQDTLADQPELPPLQTQGLEQPQSKQEHTAAPRKRKRKQKPPNSRQVEAAERHAAFKPALEQAAAALQGWLRNSGTPHLAHALVLSAAGRASCHHPTSLCLDAKKQTIPGSAGHISRAPEGGSPRAPDYIGLAAAKQSLKPKLRVPIPLPLHPCPPSPPAQPSSEQHAAGEHVATQTALQSGRRVRPGAFRQRNLFDTLHSNESDADVLAEAAAHALLLPPRCSFLMSDITNLQPLLTTGKEGYGLIVMDPPWECASRGINYPQLPSRHLLGLPIRRLMHPEGCLVGLWVTNRERHWRFVEQELLPAWGLTHLATWLWLKVTNTGQLVGPLDIEHRRPYEALLLAHSAPEALPQGRRPQEQLVIVAVPGQHSRKPHLGRLLAPHVPPSTERLELFARELAAGWTSWGNEVLHFQGLERFQARASVGGAARVEK